MARGDDQADGAPELGLGDIVAALLGSDDERLLFIARDEQRAAAFAQAAQAAAGERVVVHVPASDALPGDDAPASPGVAGQRTAALRRLGEAVAEKCNILLVTSAEAVTALVAPPDAYVAQPPILSVGDPLDLERLRETVLELGYVEDERVDEPGEVAVRGNVVDLFPGDAGEPARIEVADGRIAAIRRYSPLTQLTNAECDRLEIGAVAEPAPGAGVPLTAHLPGAILALDAGSDRRRKNMLALARDAAKRRPGRAASAICDERCWRTAVDGLRQLDLGAEYREPPPRFVEARSPERAFLRFAKKALSEVRTLALVGAERDLRFLVPRVEAALKREVSPATEWRAVLEAPTGAICSLAMPISRGFASAKVDAVAAADLLGSRADLDSGMERQLAADLFAAPDLRPGDIVIHEDHGLAAVAGLGDLPDQGGEAIILRFAGEARRLVPVGQAGKLWRYGSDEEAVPLDKLDGSTWEKRRGEIMAAIAHSARGLVALAQERAAKETPPLEPDGTRYEQLAGSFPFTETPDQLKAIAAIRSDLASGRPMDRLVVGDVGFGKTEVALRAAAIALFAGKQVALAAPTTVLARQHLETFRGRLEPLGVNVAMLSRLVSAAERKKVLAGLADGSIGIVVGTGAVAGKGVTYHDLGLVIIDEEQRFGAKDKEKLAGLGAAHVLSLTATPIPRTLQSALVGLQPVSILASPPARRQPIRTDVGPFDLAKLRTALLRERGRGGQSFVVVPRIEDMADLGQSLREQVPELSIVEAHGKMLAADIDEAMVAFAAGEGDVLLATNIIEAGLDVPRANTMVVVNAERFGLSQLHQLRGRVGRGTRRGHILLMTGKDKAIPARTMERLNTLAAFDRLGAGFAISARDLDLRGAGDLLGEEQSGHVKLIGIDLYQHLLGEALKVARCETAAPPPTELKLGMAGGFPSDWVPEEEVRLSLYLRLARLTDGAALEQFAAELTDRFGAVPLEAEVLLAESRIRLLAEAAGIAAIEAGPAAVALTPRDTKAAAPSHLEEKNGRWLFRSSSEDPLGRLLELEALLGELAEA